MSLQVYAAGRSWPMYREAEQLMDALVSSERLVREECFRGAARMLLGRSPGFNPVIHSGVSLDSNNGIHAVRIFQRLVPDTRLAAVRCGPHVQHWVALHEPSRLCLSSSGVSSEFDILLETLRDTGVNCSLEDAPEGEAPGFNEGYVAAVADEFGEHVSLMGARGIPMMLNRLSCHSRDSEPFERLEIAVADVYGDMQNPANGKPRALGRIEQARYDMARGVSQGTALGRLVGTMFDEAPLCVEIDRAEVMISAREFILSALDGPLAEEVLATVTRRLEASADNCVISASI